MHRLACLLAAGLRALGADVVTHAFFDTITLNTGAQTGAVMARALAAGMNLRRVDDAHVGISLDETTTPEIVRAIWSSVSGDGARVAAMESGLADAPDAIPASLARTGGLLAQPIFSACRSETDMLRYLRRLADRDLALDRSMIPLVRVP